MGEKDTKVGGVVWFHGDGEGVNRKSLRNKHPNWGKVWNVGLRGESSPQVDSVRARNFKDCAGVDIIIA